RLRRGRDPLAEIPRRAGHQHALERDRADHARRRPPRPPGLMYTVAFVRSASEIDAALWEACFPPPLEGRWWYETLERSHLEDQFAFSYGLILEDGREVGIAPLFLMNVPLSISLPPALRPLVQRLERALPAVFAPRTLF